MVFPNEPGRSGYVSMCCILWRSVPESPAFSVGSQLVRGTIGTWLCDKARKTVLGTLAGSTHSGHCFLTFPFVSWGAA